MFGEVFRFELRYRLRQPAVYVFAVLFFFMAFMAIATDSVQIGGAIGNVARNSPYVVIRMLAMLGGIGVMTVTVLTASAVNRDHELATQELFFSTPLRKAPYLAGRFAASVLLAWGATAVAAPGIVVSSLMPWQDPDHLVAFRLMPYVYGLVVFVLPNLFVSGVIMFAVATLTRRVLYAYVAMVAFICLWGVSNAFGRDIATDVLAAFVDPFGLGALRLAMRYWTIVERNALLPPLSGYLLVNRLLWVGVGVVFLGLTLVRFRMTLGRRGRATRLATASETDAALGTTSLGAPRFVSIATGAPTFAARIVFAQWFQATRAETAGILRSRPFFVLMLFGVANLVGTLIANVEGTTAYPHTGRMLRAIDNAFDLMLLLIIVFYSGELVWRERRHRCHELFDALPVPNWLPLTAKLAALAAISMVALFVAMLATIGYQAANGYFRFELGLYAKGLFLISLPEWLQLSALALFVQVLTNRRFLAYVVMVLYFVAMEALPAMGFDHHLYLYGTTPRAPHSDMNGYGHYVAPLLWFNIYWGLAAVGLMLLADLLWVRGTDNPVPLRLRQFAQRLTQGRAVALTAVGLAFVAAGGWIFYNANILNDYRTRDDEARLLALYERRYKQYEQVPQPRVTDVKVQVDLFPELRRADIRGDLRLVNREEEPIDQVHVLLNRDLEINAFTLPNAEVELDDREVGYRIYRLTEPLAPGATMDVQFDVSVITRGFVNGASNVRLVGNGTFFDNTHYVPRFGYDPHEELTDPDDRKDNGLPPRPRLPAVDDPVAARNPFTRDADRVTFEATLSTTLDQIAIAPGDLQREWVAEGRRYFRYRMDRPVFNFYAIVSGEYEVARDRWNDVTIEVYYHGPHHVNVPRMIEAVKKSLDYYTANFSPYQHRVVRIVEFPRYRRFAQSFPTTIPYSEGAHFVDDIRDADDIDMVFYITAHEVAHQWWGHQVCGAAVQGVTMLMESLTQYSALMVMEKEYGRDRMQQFLAYELDRYLRGRGEERIDEMPLMLVENQPYVHYNKGSLAMYALREFIGEERLNATLREFVQDYAFVGPPYPNTLELLARLRTAVPEHLQYLIEDLFETITLYDNRVEEVTASRTDDGKYRVRLAYQSRKLRSDGRGAETEIDHRDWIEVGVFGQERVNGEFHDTALYLEKHRLSSGSGTVEIIVDQEPLRAGIDPRNLFIDRVPADNVKRVAGS